MADTHQHPNLLLQTVDLATRPLATALLKLLDRISHAAIPLDAQVHAGEVALAKLLLNGILPTKRRAVPRARIFEVATRLVQYRDLVAVLELASLVTADQRVVDVCAVLGQVFQYAYGVAPFVLGEEEAVSVRNGGNVEDAICTLSGTGSSLNLV